MKEQITSLIDRLQSLVGVYRKLLDLVRIEREVLVQGDMKKIEEASFSKEALINSLRKLESDRIQQTQICLNTLGLQDPSSGISAIIEKVQGIDLELSDLLRSVHTSLRTMVDRVADQNQSNKRFVEGALTHIKKMRENILNESVPHSQTYNKKGKAAAQSGQAKILSKEV